MGEWRKSTIRLIAMSENLPQYRGKKQLIFELFEAEWWAKKCLPSSSATTLPLFMKTSDLNLYYRLRINGKWLNLGEADYYFLTKKQILEIYSDQNI